MRLRSVSPTLLRVTALVAAALLVLAWNDVLPGGWRMRGWLEPHAERETRRHESHQLERLREFAREEVAPGSIVFVGSSTIERFPLAREFPDLPVVNRGIAETRALELARCIDAWLPREPRSIVVYVGSADRIVAGASLERIAADVDAFLRALRERAPTTPCLVLGPLSERAASPAVVERVSSLERSIADAARAHGLAFLPLARPPLSTPDGALAEEFSVDAWHLNAAGYDVLARWIADAAGFEASTSR